MTYTIAIDWLSIFCGAKAGIFAPAGTLRTIADGDIIERPRYDIHPAKNWQYKKADHGTRQFRELWEVTLAGDLIAEVQGYPCSPKIMTEEKCIVKFSNRLLYQPDLWEVVEAFMTDHNLQPLSISRIDIAGDFHRFVSYEPIPFISDFLAHKIRHVGRGQGGAYFNHGSREIDGCSQSFINYTGLSFGQHASDTRVYLYNKTWELKTQHDKPWIRDFWAANGLLGLHDVWRLEVSIKSGGTKFKDKTTDREISITPSVVTLPDEICKLYHTFVAKQFAFIKNRQGITNVTREPRLQLFDGHPHYTHRALRPVTGGNRTEKILIRQLWQMATTYRGDDLHTDEGLTKSMATALATSTDLKQWLERKQNEWTPTRHK